MERCRRNFANAIIKNVIFVQNTFEIEASILFTSFDESYSL